MKKLSVIIPVYNAKKYIPHCVESLSRQGFNSDELEIIFVDDVSTDGTYDFIVENYGNNGNIIVHKQEQNGGPGRARNKGIDIATGEYICFLDADDAYEDNSLITMYNYVSEFDADMLYIAGYLIPACEKIPEDISVLTAHDTVRLVFGSREVKHGLIHETSDTKERINNWLEHKYHWNVWSKLYKKSLLDKNNIRFSDLKIAEDQLFSLNCFLKAENLYSSIDFMYKYRIGEESVSHGKDNCKLLVKALEAMFASPAHLKVIYDSIGYFNDNPGDAKRLSDFHIKTIENNYAIPNYQKTGREKAVSSGDVKNVFYKYFGEKADFVMERLFGLYDTKPEMDGIDNIYTTVYWHNFKEQYGDDIIIGGKNKMTRMSEYLE